MPNYLVTYDYLYHSSQEGKVKKSHDAAFVSAPSFPKANELALEVIKRKTGRPLEAIVSLKVELMESC